MSTQKQNFIFDKPYRASTWNQVSNSGKNNENTLIDSVLSVGISSQSKDSIQKTSVNPTKQIMGNAELKKCISGMIDAENFHGKKGTHLVLGFLFGPFSIIGTLVSKTTPNRGKYTYIRSKNVDLFDDLQYIKCYKKKAKKQLVGMEAIGWGIWIAVVFLLL